MAPPDSALHALGSGGKTCVILYDRVLLFDADRLLIRQLRGRGFEVHAVRVGAGASPALGSTWSGRVRSRVEKMFGRGAESATTEGWPGLRPGPAVSRAELQRIVASIRPQLVISFVHSNVLATLDPGDGVYELWVDGVPQTLAIERALASTSASFEVVVTSRPRPADAPRIVQRASLPALGTWAAVDQAALARRAVVLLLRAVDGAATGGEELLPTPARPGSDHALRRGISTVVGAIHRGLVRRWKRVDAWFLAYRTRGTNDFRVLFGGSSRFFADPCVVRAGDEHYVFYEDYSYAEARGVISFSRLQDDGSLSSPERVLERPYHLSYPFVFEHADQWWMVPESSANRTVDLYRAKEFPRRWERACTLLEGVEAVDATLHRDEGGWWMFVNVAEEGSSSWDELSIYRADELRGPWRAHPGNPVKCDASSARPAGRLFRRGEKLIRPAQDCSRIYGGGVRFCAIDTLTETGFSEHVVEVLPPSTIPGAEALHTWSADGDLEVVDARLPLAWLDEPRFNRQLHGVK